MTFVSQVLVTVTGVTGNNSYSSASKLTIASLEKATNSRNPLPQYSQQKGWIELGPRPLLSPNSHFQEGSIASGRITALAVNQSNSKIIYAGAAQGGVWKTTNGGKTWIPLTDNQISLAIGSITLSANQKTILVGTGEPNHSGDSYPGNGILKSTDGGNSWSVLGSSVFANSSISGIIINQTNPNWIVASTTYGYCCGGLKGEYNSHGMGIFLSKNGGQTWSATNLIGNVKSTYSGIAQLIPDPVNDNIIFATDYNGGIWESTNTGQYWTKININTPVSNPSRSAIGISKSNPNLLYIAFTDSKSNLANILTYNLTSGNIKNIPSLPSSVNGYSPCNSQCVYDLVMVVNPINPNILYFGGVNLYRSTNAGTSWTPISVDSTTNIQVIHHDFHALAFFSNEIFVGSDGGVFSSTDFGSTWNNLNSDLGITQFWHISASPTSDSVIIGGTQDNGCDKYANNTSWNVVLGGDGGSTVFSSDASVICGTDINHNPLQLQESNNGGLSWHSSYTGINTKDTTSFYPPMAQDYLDSSIIYIGSTNLYKSTNFGSSWTLVSGLQNSAIIDTITLSTSNPNIIAISNMAGQVKLTTNGGKTWQTILDTSKMFPNYYSNTIIPVSSVAIDPVNPSHIFVSLGNNMKPKLLETTNEGLTWQVLQNLGQIPANDSINVMKYNPVSNTLFLGTDRGMFYYNGTNFYTLGSGLPNSAVFDLTFTHSNYLLAATHGRGIWLNYMTPEATLHGVTNNSFPSPRTNFTLTVSDPNGFSKESYSWGNELNQSFSSTADLTIPSNQTNLQLNVYAQDAAGNWMHTVFIFNPKNTPKNTYNDIIIIGGIFFVVIVVLIFIRKRK